MRVFGHRGSPGFPRFGENTRASFQKALDAGASGFELDVRRCGDGSLVVIHDATIDRTTNATRLVASFSYADLRRFDAGSGDTIPRLSDILDEFSARCCIHIEVKESGLTSDVAAMARERRIENQIVISGFDADDNDPLSSSSWNDLAAVASIVPVALLATRRKIERIGNDAFVRDAQHRRASALHAPRDAANSDLIQRASAAGLPVRVWTVNDPTEVHHWRDLGVESIFSDFPERCLKVLAA